MNNTDQRTAADLRSLADLAAPAIKAQPDLASVALFAASKRRKSVRRRLAAGTCVVIAAGAVAASNLIGSGDFQYWYQPSAAMEPTVVVGQSVILSKQTAPGRGDVVLIKARHDRASFELLSRVIGLPGDTVACPAEADGSCKALVVSGRPVAEPWLTAATQPFSPVAVGPGQVFLLGDARDFARDSRDVGPQRLDAVLGVAVARVAKDGTRESLPGAPKHPLPGDGDTIDPRGPIPESGVSE